MSIDIFGYIAGALGIIGLAYSILRSQLPTTKIRDLEAIIKETQDIFSSATEDGLLTNPNFITQVEGELLLYKDEAAAYRAQALSTTSFYQECIEMVKGLSKAISILYGDVAQLRASVLTTSEKERQRLHGCIRSRSRRLGALPIYRPTNLSICSNGYSISGDCNTLVDVPPRSHHKLLPVRSRSCPPIDEGTVSSGYPPPFLMEFQKAKAQAPVLYGPLPRPAGFMLSPTQLPYQ